MKKILAVVCAAALVFAFMAGCGNSAGSSSAAPSGSGAASGLETPNKTDALPGEGKTIALVCDVAGTQVFVLSMIDGLNAAAEKYGFKPIVVECGDSAAYEDNIRALVEEGTDLIIVGGWQGGEALNKISTEFPDKADYALVDSTIESEVVKCIAYREQEGAYLVGLIAGQAVSNLEKPSNIFGAVHVNQGPGSWKWRYGFMEGVKAINPDATFTFNFTGSYNDAAKAKEYALLQAQQGCQFINAAAAGGDIGVQEAALEKKFFTSGQDVDLTTPNNPYIITSQIKDTNTTIQYLIENYLTKEWSHDNEVWGIAEGTIGAVHVTHESVNPVSDALTKEQWDRVKQAAEDIRTGKLDMTKIPTEEEYGK